MTTFLQPYCFFCVYGSKLVPDLVSEILGVGSVGATGSSQLDPRRKPRDSSGASRQRPWWILDTSKHVQARHLTPHLEWLMNSVDVTKLRGIENIEDISITVYLGMQKDKEGFILPGQFLSFASAIGASLEIDVEYWGVESRRAT